MVVSVGVGKAHDSCHHVIVAQRVCRSGRPSREFLRVSKHRRLGLVLVRRGRSNVGMTEPRRFTLDDLLAEARANLVRVTPHRANAEAAAGAVILDTRQDTRRWSDGVIGGSFHLPRTVLEWALDPASGCPNSYLAGFDQVLIVMCQDGYSSSLAAHNLQRIGFCNATDMIGGFDAWRAAGLPVQPAQLRDLGVLEGRWPPEPIDRPRRVAPVAAQLRFGA